MILSPSTPKLKLLSGYLFVFQETIVDLIGDGFKANDIS